ncbi:hypothetical protein P691DRAFT_162226 [Macrolepiota fuliginosa MF-IS2]|uniref:BAG domain-containing protein n=1 Tax=Macrolepiota fuliginosa MF-IS2 TaxID=1400762 RepID=A0A9P6C5B4_9AGAR|nr:hypothetical protein P691DRAFT_162226 [Macrolepiota fuliginosa MF-IS2]
MLVKWQRERFSVDFPGPAASLRSIRDRLADLTHLPQNAFKLIHKGAVMKDDSAPLSAYSLQPNSTIVLIGTDAPPQPVPASAAASQASSEQATVALIQAELSAVRTQLTPDVRAFLAALDPAAHSNPSHRDHSRLGELLLQSLLRLDAIDPDRDWLTARAERKAAVKEVQELLDSLDAAWAAFSNPPPPQ